MRYITLPGTDLTVSQIQLGTAVFGVVPTHEGMAAVPETDAFRQMDEFVELGGNFLDTAHVYSDWIPGEKARSEKTIGRWLHERHFRDRILLCTKGGIDFAVHNSFHGPPIDLSKKELEKDLEESLINLQTDYVDIFWLHRDEPSRPVGEIMETLNGLIRQGRTRYIGCSNWLPDRIMKAQQYAADHGLQPFIASQFEWSLARMFCPEAPLDELPYMDSAMYDFHCRTGMTAFAYSSQGKGFFTKLEQLGPDRLPELQRRHYLNDRNLKTFARIRKLSEETGYTTTQITIAFINSQYRFVGIPIVFARKYSQFVDTMTAADIHLTPEMIDMLLDEGDLS